MDSQMVEEITTKGTKVHEVSTLFLREPSCSQWFVISGL
jgi:hypothetical protein